MKKSLTILLIFFVINCYSQKIPLTIIDEKISLIPVTFIGNTHFFYLTTDDIPRMAINREEATKLALIDYLREDSVNQHKFEKVGIAVILKELTIGGRTVYNIPAVVVYHIDFDYLLSPNTIDLFGPNSIDSDSNLVFEGTHEYNSPYKYSNSNNYNTGTDSWTLENCKLRAKPSAIGDVITYIGKGSSIKILNYAEAGYYRISYNGMTGYVNKSYIYVGG